MLLTILSKSFIYLIQQKSLMSKKLGDLSTKKKRYCSLKNPMHPAINTRKPIRSVPKQTVHPQLGPNKHEILTI